MARTKAKDRKARARKAEIKQALRAVAASEAVAAHAAAAAQRATRLAAFCERQAAAARDRHALVSGKDADALESLFIEHDDGEVEFFPRSPAKENNDSLQL